MRHSRNVFAQFFLDASICHKSKFLLKLTAAFVAASKWLLFTGALSRSVTFCPVAVVLIWYAAAADCCVMFLKCNCCSRLLWGVQLSPRWICGALMMPKMALLTCCCRFCFLFACRSEVSCWLLSFGVALVRWVHNAQHAWNPPCLLQGVVMLCWCSCLSFYSFLLVNNSLVIKI